MEDYERFVDDVCNCPLKNIRRLKFKNIDFSLILKDLDNLEVRCLLLCCQYKDDKEKIMFLSKVLEEIKLRKYIICS